MKISALIAKLEQHKLDFGDIDVVISADSEGNSYHKLSSQSACVAEDLSTYYIELVDEDSFESDDEFISHINCVVIWP
ncbi:hypothetical protein D3C85_1029400 [compost metagenome]